MVGGGGAVLITYKSAAMAKSVAERVTRVGGIGMRLAPT